MCYTCITLHNILSYYAVNDRILNKRICILYTLQEWHINSQEFTDSNKGRSERDQNDTVIENRNFEVELMVLPEEVQIGGVMVKRPEVSPSRLSLIQRERVSVYARPLLFSLGNSEDELDGSLTNTRVRHNKFYSLQLS